MVAEAAILDLNVGLSAWYAPYGRSNYHVVPGGAIVGRSKDSPTRALAVHAWWYSKLILPLPLNTIRSFITSFLLAECI